MLVQLRPAAWRGSHRSREQSLKLRPPLALGSQGASCGFQRSAELAGRTRRAWLIEREGGDAGRNVPPGAVEPARVAWVERQAAHVAGEGVGPAHGAPPMRTPGVQPARHLVSVAPFEARHRMRSAVISTARASLKP